MKDAEAMIEVKIKLEALTKSEILHHIWQDLIVESLVIEDALDVKELVTALLSVLLYKSTSIKALLFVIAKGVAY